MHKSLYQSYDSDWRLDRRRFLKFGSAAVGAGLVLGTPAGWSQAQEKSNVPTTPKTNIDEALKIPRTEHSLPGPFPGKVVEVHDAQAMQDDQAVPERVNAMFERGVTNLTGEDRSKSFSRFFTKADVVGIKVNPVGAGLISTRLEVVDAIIQWLETNGLPRHNIVIWDRFDFMLTEAGFTTERFPGVRIEGLQTMDEAAAEEKSEDNSRWLDATGNHISADKFDQAVYYWADVEAPQDLGYLNQHVFNGKYSYFGKLLTQTLTKIINVPVFKNTGNGISMATKNLGYGAICNTNRLHRPLFFNVCTEVLAFPVIRDKLVLNITDGLRGQFEGGPGPNSQYVYEPKTLYFATDPFALDMVCHQQLVEKRKAMQVDVNEHPRFTEYLRYAERLGLGVVDAEKMQHMRLS